MKTLVLLLSMVFFSHAVFSQIPENWQNGLDEELSQLLEDWKVSGFAVAVVEKKNIIYAKGFGYKDYENKLPVTPNTLFAIGSSSKAFTSGLLGILAEEGRLSFNDSPIKYIPGLRFNNDEMNNQITIKDIITHRTGLPRHDLSWYLFSSNSRDSLVQRIQFQEPFAKVRERWYYNNFMYLTQGVIAEKITGKSWEDNIQEKYFIPLEMNTSSTIINGLKNGKDASKGYQVKQDSIIEKMDYYDIAGMGPAGSINSSVNEMSNWLITWINGGKFKDKQILPEAYVKEAISPQMIMANSIPDKDFPDLHFSTYGYAWMTSSYKGHYRVEHGGNIDGFSANAAFFPSDSVGIVVLSNQNGSVIPGLVRNLISDRILNVSPTEWNKYYLERSEKAKASQKEMSESQKSNQKKGTKPSHHLIEFEGDYSNPGYGKMEIYVGKDSLIAKTKTMKIWLKHYHYNIFTPFPYSDGKVDTTQSFPIVFNFKTNDQGEIASLSTKMEPTIEPIEFKRIAKVVEVDEKSLERLVGEYDLAGQISKFYTKPNQSTSLFLFVSGQPEYELLAIGKDKFTIKIVEGFTIEFIEDEEGKIIEAKFTQPNGVFVAKKK